MEAESTLPTAPTAGDAIWDVILVAINIFAIIGGPIVAVLITRHLQTRAEKRRDKKDIFRTLMTYRGLNWANPECVNSLNLIEVVFYDNQNVVKKWKALLDKYCTDHFEQSDYPKIVTARDRLLEAMAQDLGYSEHIDWETIQHSYVPKWMTDNNIKQQQFMDMQLSIGNMLINSALSQPPGQDDQQETSSSSVA